MGQTMDIQTGDPTEDGRYVVWTPCAARQIAEWCEPSLQTWQGGRWHHGEPVTCWIGPLPVVHSKPGEIAGHFHMSPVEEWAKPGEVVNVAPCPHEKTSTAQTGDGRDVETCLDCGKHIFIGPLPEETEYDL